MSFSTLSTVSIILALLGAAVALACAILVCARRRQRAHRALTLVLVVLTGAAVSAFSAAAVGQHDLQTRARRVLSLAASAERSARARSGHYITSVARLRALNPALALEMRDDGATVRVYRVRPRGSVRLRASLGFGSLAWHTLRAAPPVSDWKVS